MKCSERPDFAVLLVEPSAHGKWLDCALKRSDPGLRGCSSVGQLMSGCNP
jgi:hypothetical protein